MNCWIQAYLQGMKQSMDGPFLIQEKEAGRDDRSVFVGGLKSFRLGLNILKQNLEMHKGLCSTALDLLIRRVRILPHGVSVWGQLESHADFSVTSETFIKPVSRLNQAGS